MADVQSLEPKAVVAASSRGYASPSDWDPVRPLIRRLYCDEGKTLKEVMVIMDRDYGHRATVKMYKSRITKWNLDKKTKEAEAWALLRIKMQRDTVGKDSAFRVRGKVVTTDDVLRYFNRKGILNPEVEAQPPAASIPLAIEYWTPVSSPTPGFTTIQGPEEEDVQNGADLLEFRGAEMSVVSYTATLDSAQDNNDVHEYLNLHQTRQILFSIPEIRPFEIPYSPLPPQSLLVSGKLFASIKAYYGGAFNSGLFGTNDEGYLISVNKTTRGDQLFEFYQLCYTGAELMDSKSFVEGRRCFSKASGLVSHLLRRQDPRTLGYILRVLIKLKNNGYNKIVTILRNLTRGLAIILFAEEHPWRQIFPQIGDLDDSHFELALAEAWRCIYDTFANCLGQFHQTTLIYYTAFITCVYSSNDAPQLLHGLLVRGEQELGKFDARLLKIKFSYGRALYTQDRNAEAMAVLEDLLVRCREVDGHEDMVINTLHLISWCQYAMGHEYEAESKLQEATERVEASYGNFCSNLLWLKIQLARWFHEWGREAESSALKAEVDEILGPDDIKLEEITLEKF